MLKQKNILIIDGYNVLRNGAKYAQKAGVAPDFKDWNFEHINAAREELLNDVFQMLENNQEAIIVYDAANFKGDRLELPTKTNLKNVQVIFSKQGQSADEVIQSLAFNAQKHGHRVKVVSSDKQIQDTIMREGVVRMSSREFEIHAKDVNEQNSKQILSGYAKASSAKVENIVDKKTAQKLLDLRNSL